jgi:hypothetical protein
MTDRPKTCSKCLDLVRNYGTVPKDSDNFSMIFANRNVKDPHYKAAQKALESCPNKCILWLLAANCTIDQDGNVTVDNSGRKY